MELWSKIRRLLARGMSKRHAVKHFNLIDLAVKNDQYTKVACRPKATCHFLRPRQYRSVCKAMEAMEAKKKLLYMPLAHPPGEAQFDFGFADAVIGGVASKITFDNSKVNTKKILYGRGTEPSIGLLQIASHHLFEYHFCRIYEPQEKGHVENCVKYSRNNFMVPVPHFATFSAFNTGAYFNIF